jgi:hypothetical protein
LSDYLCEIPPVFGLRAETAFNPEAKPKRNHRFRPIRHLFIPVFGAESAVSNDPTASITAGRFSGIKPYRTLHDSFRTPAGTESPFGPGSDCFNIKPIADFTSEKRRF